MSDLFEQLLPVKWRDVEFPITRLRMSLAHDLVQHKSWGVDGARIEATGLEPMRFTMSIPLTNGIVPGKNERWQILYPNAFRTLVTAVQKKESGEFQHPEFGFILCKAERIEIDWDATKRGGVDCELSLISTNRETDQEDFAESPVTSIDLAALSLESSGADLEAILAASGIEIPGEWVTDLTDLARKIQAIADYPTLLAYRGAGQFNRIKYRVGKVQQSLEATKSALTWPAKRECERIKADAHEAERKVLDAQRSATIKFFKVPADTTLAGVVRQIPDAKVGDLVKLNPGIMTSPLVAAGTTVRYFARAA